MTAKEQARAILDGIPFHSDLVFERLTRAILKAKIEGLAYCETHTKRERFHYLAALRSELRELEGT